jgi:predicted GNAT superfamily acetyltransferase
MTARADESAPRTPVQDVVVRHLATIEECAACVEIQNEVWGASFSDTTPISLIHVAPRVGGIAAGAFAPDGTMLGFVFGISGVRDGELVHWSHMLAVRPGARNEGIGRRLKEFQREALRRLGVRRLYWTFDPLVARNAHLNLNRLGARVVDYVPNLYGASASPLHLGLDTDRAVVEWATERDATPTDAAVPRADDAKLPILSPVPRAGDDVFDLHARGAERPPVVLLETPVDIAAVLADSPELARRWRAATREHFQWGLAAGYAITALRRDPVAARAFYVLHLPRA